MEHKEKVKIIKDWLNQPGWDIISKELADEADALNTQLIESDDDNLARVLRLELRMYRKFINKLVDYSKMS